MRLDLMEERMLRPAKVKRLLDISAPTFRKWVARGILPASKIDTRGGRYVLRIPESSVRALLEQRVVPE